MIYCNQLKQNMQAMQFPLGNVYIIVCAAQNQSYALRIQENDVEKFKDSRIVGVHPNADDVGQLFMVEKTGIEEDSYEIVNCLSNYVFDEEKKEIHLKKGKQISDQLFKIEGVPDHQGYYWIKTSEEGDMAVSLQGILRYKQFNPNDPTQIFRFIPADQSAALRGCSIIINNNSGKALDVPDGSLKPDTRIIQYNPHYRFNQRWRFVRHGNGYIIQNSLTKLCLDIAGEKKAGGSAVIQWTRTGNSNQLWMLEEAGNQLYKIASLHAPGMYLTIQHQSQQNFGKLEIWDQQNPAWYWRIQGYLPESR